MSVLLGVDGLPVVPKSESIMECCSAKLYSSMGSEVSQEAWARVIELFCECVRDSLRCSDTCVDCSLL